MNHLSKNPVMPTTSTHVLRWIETTKAIQVTEEEKSLIDSGTIDGRRRLLEILFARPFLAIDYSFHATLRAYCECIIRADFGTHDAANMRTVLSFVYPYATEMIETDFIDADLAQLLTDPKITQFAGN